MNLYRLASMLDASLWGPEPDDVPIKRVIHDSRQAQPGDVFVAIKGEHADGHQFLKQAAAGKVAAALVNKS